MSYTWWQVCLIAVIVTVCVIFLLLATGSTVATVIKAKQESKITEEMKYLSGQLEDIEKKNQDARRHGEDYGI